MKLCVSCGFSRKEHRFAWKTCAKLERVDVCGSCVDTRHSRTMEKSKTWVLENRQRYQQTNTPQTYYVRKGR